MKHSLETAARIKQKLKKALLGTSQVKKSRTLLTSTATPAGEAIKSGNVNKTGADFTLRARTDDNVFFVLGPARSGTSATIRALSQATNVKCYEQKAPRFIKSVREYEIGVFNDVEPLVLERRWPDIREALEQGKIYGEKDQQVYPWVSHYWRLFGGRYVHVVKDGRDAVRSLMDFYRNVNGLLYLDAPDPENLAADVYAAQRAGLSNDGAREAELYRPRPCPGDKAFSEWGNIPRIGMVGWYWSHVIRVCAKELRKVPASRQMRIDFTGGPSIERFEELYRFLRLEGFNPEALSRFLETRPNSIKSKLRVDKPPFPAWPEWTDEQMACFDLYAADAMVENGYYPIDRFQFQVSEEAFNSSTITMPHCKAPVDLVTSIMTALLSARNSLVVSGTSTILIPDPELANVATELWERHGGSPIVWRGGAPGSIPLEPSDHILALGMLENTVDIVRLLKRLADTAKSTLILGNLIAPFSDHIDNSYMSATPHYGNFNKVSLSSVLSILENSLGFQSVTVRYVDTGWALNPRMQIVVAIRSTSSASNFE